jgi:hypothetical protein
LIDLPAPFGQFLLVVPLCRFYILEPDTAWKLNSRELARRNTHNVPRDKEHSGSARTLSTSFENMPIFKN